MEADLQRMAPTKSCSPSSFQQLAEFSGSEKEREAHRKNRVIQMRLEVCLSEITLQQRSSAQILRMEGVRFLHKAQHGRSQPRSARMLAQFRSHQSQVNTAASNNLSRRACTNNTRLHPTTASSLTREGSLLYNNLSRRACTNSTRPHPTSASSLTREQPLLYNKNMESLSQNSK